MKKILFLLTLLLNGCVNQNGLSTHYYDDCHIVYDYYGTYKTKCDDNLYKFKKKNKKDCLQCN